MPKKINKFYLFLKKKPKSFPFLKNCIIFDSKSKIHPIISPLLQ